MSPELNWCGHPIQPGEGYGGREEWIPEIRKPALAAAKHAAKGHYCVVTETHLAEVFASGAYKLTKAQAAKRLELLTGIHRTTCYRALRLNGRFGRHLRAEGELLTWR